MTLTVRVRTVLAALAVIALVAGASAVAGATLAPRATAVPATSFPDVPPDAFYTDAVAWAKDLGVTTGVGNTGQFQPDANVTRGQMVTFLRRLYDLTLPRDQIVISHSTGHLQPYVGDNPTLERFAGFVRVTSDGNDDVLVPVTGPDAIGEVDYVLQSVTWCRAAGATAVASAEMFGDSETTGFDTQVAADPTPRTAGGCYTLTLDSVTTNAELILRIAAGEVVLTALRSTWVPRADFRPAPDVGILGASQLDQ